MPTLVQTSTSEYKITPLKKAARELPGYPHPRRVPRGVYAEQAIGISTDEFTRAKDSGLRFLRNFELVDDSDEDFIRDINQRRAELRAQREHLETQLAEVEQRILAAPNPGLIDALPRDEDRNRSTTRGTGPSPVRSPPTGDPHNRDPHTATCRDTLTGPTITAAGRTAHDAAVLSFNDAGSAVTSANKCRGNGSRAPRVTILFPILVVPPVRFERTLDGF